MAKGGEIIGNEGQELTFTLLTKQIFDEKVKGRIFGSIDFLNDEALQNYYLSQEFGYM